MLGKILRLDVNGPDGIPGTADDADPVTGTPYRTPAGNPFSGAGQRKEIFAYGLRNPWRNSFDRLTGDLWIGDVGQDHREEIDVAFGNPAGRNYGWKCEEGFSCTALPNCPTCPAIVPGTTQPIADYSHANDALLAPFNFRGCAIIGGYIYRGCAMPWLHGSYFFTDECTPTFFSFHNDVTAITGLTNRTSQMQPSGSTISQTLTYDEDAAGEKYIFYKNCGTPTAGPHLQDRACGRNSRLPPRLRHRRLQLRWRHRNRRRHRRVLHVPLGQLSRGPLLQQRRL